MHEKSVRNVPNVDSGFRNDRLSSKPFAESVEKRYKKDTDLLDNSATRVLKRHNPLGVHYLKRGGKEQPHPPPLATAPNFSGTFPSPLYEHPNEREQKSRQQHSIMLQLC